MGFRRIIGQVVKTSTSGSVTAECDVVSNIEITPSATQGTVFITWDEPACGDCFSKYAVYIDGSKVGETIVPAFQHEGLVGSTTYTIAIYVINKAGVQCSTGTSLGYTTGSFPSLTPFLIPHYKAATLIWSLLPSTENYTIEGYNVYYDDDGTWVKQNGTLLGTGIDSYLKTDLALRENVTMAVSYEYDGGNESTKFPATATLPGIPGGDYKITIQKSYIPSQSNGKYPLVAVGRIPVIYRGGWRSLGVGIITGGEATVGWGSPDSGTATLNSLATRKFRFINTASTPGTLSYTAYYGTSLSNYKYKLQIGCRDQDGMLYRGGSKRRERITEGKLTGGFWRDNNAFLFSGYCDGITYNDIGIEFTIHVDPDSFLGVGVPPANWTDISVTEIYNPMAPTATVSGGNDVSITWDAQEGTQGYNVYFKEVGESSYTKQNSSLITGTSFSVTNVPAGNYTVAVTMVYENYESIIDDGLTKDTFTTT